MLELPPKLKIGFRDYEVKSLERGAVNDDGDELLGRHHWQATIEINPHYNPEEVVGSMIHEALHAMIDVYHFPFKRQKDEETFFRQWTGPWTAFFRDNPDVIKWIHKLCLTRIQAGRLQKPVRIQRLPIPQTTIKKV